MYTIFITNGNTFLLLVLLHEHDEMLRLITPLFSSFRSKLGATQNTAVTPRPQMHMEFCELHQRRSQITRDRGLRLQDRTTRWQQSGVGRASRDIPTPRADSAPNQQEQQRPLTAPRTARKYVKYTLPQKHTTTSYDDTTNAGPRPGFGSSGDSTSGDTTRDDGEKIEENAAIGAPANDGRIACSNCGRWFSSDRVGVHQDICKRVNTAALSPGGNGNKSGTGKAARNKNTTSASSFSVRSSRRRSSCSVLGGNRTAMARAPGARGRSVGLEKGSIRDLYVIDDAGETMFSSGSHCRNKHWSPELDGWSQREAQKQQTEERQWKEGNTSATPGGESLGHHQAAPRPSSAAGGRAWPFDVAGPLASAARYRTRPYTGRAVSTSCSPVRLRRSSTSAIAVRPARGERSNKRGSVIVGTGREGFENGARYGAGRAGGNSNITFARDTKLSGQGVPDRGVERRGCYWAGMVSSRPLEMDRGFACSSSTK